VRAGARPTPCLCSSAVRSYAGVGGCPPQLSKERWWFLQARQALAHGVSHGSKESTELGLLASRGCTTPSPHHTVVPLFNRAVSPPRPPCFLLRWCPELAATKCGDRHQPLQNQELSKISSLVFRSCQWVPACCVKISMIFFYSIVFLRVFFILYILKGSIFCTVNLQ